MSSISQQTKVDNSRMRVAYFLAELQKQNSRYMQLQCLLQVADVHVNAAVQRIRLEIECVRKSRDEAEICLRQSQWMVGYAVMELVRIREAVGNGSVTPEDSEWIGTEWWGIVDEDPSTYDGHMQRHAQLTNVLETQNGDIIELQCELEVTRWEKNPQNVETLARRIRSLIEKRDDTRRLIEESERFVEEWGRECALLY